MIKSNKFPVSADCVLVSKLNPRTPRVWMPDLTGERRAICSTEFLVMTPKSPITCEFLWCLFSSDAFTSEFATFVTGTSGSHQRVMPESLLGVDAIIPPVPLVGRFTEIVRPWLKQAAHNIREANTLAALRETLLPKLLSGELRVKNAEKQLTRGRRHAWWFTRETRSWRRESTKSAQRAMPTDFRGLCGLSWGNSRRTR